jgi:Kdo2-lipid IVA lauroyltransferase/acyltransferase
MREAFKRCIRHPIEAALLLGAYAAFRALPLDAASAIGGWLGRTFGPHFPVSGQARKNLARAMPELSAEPIERIVRGMWDNLGRLLGEYPHLERIAGDAGRLEIVNPDVFEMLRRGKRGAILFTGHFANWEMLAHVAKLQGGTYSQVTRMPNNPLVARALARLRRMAPEALVPKGAGGARRSLAVLRHGGWLGMAVDQRMSDGVALPFFGRGAMTSTGMVRLGLRFESPVVPVQLERLGGCRFRLTLHPPLRLSRTGDVAADSAIVMAEVNAMLEDWIRARPEQWLWLHRRWSD